MKNKFKKNEWIINLVDPKYNPDKIIEINNATGCYVIQNDYAVFEYTFDRVENNYRLWSINDAHNGDVLYIEEKNSIWFILFKNLYENGIIHAHYSWCLNTDGKYEDDENGWGKINDCTKISPVSKELKDLFFKTLKDIYVWDDKKKELNLRVLSKECDDTCNCETCVNCGDCKGHMNHAHEFDYDAEIIEEKITIPEEYVAIIDNNEIILKPREDYVNAYNSGRKSVIDEVNKMIKNLNK